MTDHKPSETAAELHSDIDSPVVARRGIIPARIWRLMRSGTFQVIVSSIVGAVVVLAEVAEGVKRTDLALSTFGSYFGFLVGLGAILILVSSIAAGLLVYYLQALKADYNYYYDHFRDAITDLRNYLDSLHDRGVISRAYDIPYRKIELLMQSKFLVLYWTYSSQGFVDSIYEELRKKLHKQEELEWAFGGITMRLAIAEEAVNNTALNLLRRIGSRLWLNPVVKFFGHLQRSFL